MHSFVKVNVIETLFETVSSGFCSCAIALPAFLFVIRSFSACCKGVGHTFGQFIRPVFDYDYESCSNPVRF